MYNRPQTQENFLKNRQSMFIEEEQSYKTLFDFLEKKIKNSIVVPMPEDNIENIIKRGELKEFSGRFIKGKASRCHENSALYAEKHKNIKLMTGYAFTEEDGLWRQHSWLLKDNEVIESTPIARNYYFGYVLTNEEKEIFINNEK